jgi:hypothetical protein
MPTKTILAVLAATLLALVAACGTAGDGGKSSSAADAQAPASLDPQAAADAPTAMPPPVIPIPRPQGPGSAPAADVPSGGPCTTAADCVAATCCHPKTCVAKAQAPSCAGTMCTMDCRTGTMDCGGGSCICQDGACAAELKKPGYVKGIEGAIAPQ